MQKFVILSIQRTGSGWLSTLLDSHPEIRCHSELLVRGRSAEFAVPPGVPANLAEPAYRQEYPVEYVEAVLGMSQGLSAAGFKLMAGQNDQMLSAIAEDPAWKIIVLRRDNALAAYASNLLAKATGQSHAFGRGVSAMPLVRFDQQEFDRQTATRAKRLDRMTAALRGRPYLAVEYTELGQSETRERILEQLGVRSDVALSSPLHKRGSREIFVRFSNPEDIAGCDAWRYEG